MRDSMCEARRKIDKPSTANLVKKKGKGKEAAGSNKRREREEEKSGVFSIPRKPAKNAPTPKKKDEGAKRDSGRKMEIEVGQEFTAPDPGNVHLPFS